MIFEFVVAKTFGLRTDHLAVLTFLVAPRKVEPIFGFLRNRKADWLPNIQIIKFLLRCIHSCLK